MPWPSRRNPCENDNRPVKTSVNLQRLVHIGSAELSESTPRLPGECLTLAGALGQDLLQMYWLRNGFFAFESALHVFPLGTARGGYDLLQWNSAGLWQHRYGKDSENCLFFAEDIFAGQFCIYKDSIYRFDPETGKKEFLASSVDGWAKLVLEDPEFQTGWPVAHAWQEHHGRLPESDRLIPHIPFVLGGSFDLENLHSVNALKAMEFYADVASQIASLPDGTRVRLKVVE